MSTSTRLGDDLMKVPQLNVAGTNWVVYKDRFTWAIDARGLLEHVNGSKWEPTRPTLKGKKARGSSKEGEAAGEGFEVVEELTAEDEKKLEVWKKELRVWKLGEAVVKQQIAATIPDSLFMKIRTKGTARQIWEALMKDFQNKSRMVSVDLRRRLHQQHCAEKGNVQLHFDTLRLMREDLASMGHSPSEDDFYAILIGSLPPSYDPYVSALNATSSVLGTFLSPDDLMQTITDEYERRNLGKTAKQEENAAFTAEDGHRGKSALTCFNCGKKGHKKADCWGEGGGKAGEAPWQKEKDRSDEKGEGKGKEDKGKGKEVAASMQEYVAAWMVMSKESDFEDSNKDLLPSSPYPSLDELLNGFTPNNNNNKISTASPFPNCKQMEESDDEDDEGVLDEWEDDSEETELEYADKVVRESVPLEGEMEDLDMLEEIWASVNPIPAKIDMQRTPPPIPESIFEEDSEGVLLPAPPIAEDVQRTRKDIDAITTPRENLEMAESVRDEEEDQAMALWLSDPEDDENIADEEDRAGIQIGNELVEGKREDLGRANEAGNQPIPQSAEPKSKPDSPTTVQVEEQGECRGTAASGENADAGRSGEGVDEADKATRAFARIATEDLEPLHMSLGQPRGEGGGKEGVSWINPRKHPKGRRKVNPEIAERRKVNSDVEDDAKSIPPNFDDADLTPTPMDHDETLSKGQHPPKSYAALSIAIDAINLEEPPQISSDKSRGGGGTPCINAREHEGGTTHLDRVKRDLRGLGGEGAMSLASGDEGSHLPVFQDAGGVPQHRKVGYRPMVDGRPVPGTPRKGANAMWTTKAEEDKIATVGTQMWPRGPTDPFWEMFPPLEIDKLDINGTRPRDVRDGRVERNGGNLDVNGLFQV